VQSLNYLGLDATPYTHPRLDLNEFRSMRTVALAEVLLGVERSQAGNNALVVSTQSRKITWMLFFQWS